MYSITVTISILLIEETKGTDANSPKDPKQIDLRT